MDVLSRVQMLCKDKKIGIAKMERDIGLSKGASYKWKSSNPSMDVLKKLSAYFNVPVGHITGAEDKEWEPTITEKDERDIKNIIEALKSKLSTEQGLMYDGEPMDEESQQNVLAAIEVAERTAILEAKRRFTPDKYKK